MLDASVLRYFSMTTYRPGSTGSSHLVKNVPWRVSNISRTPCSSRFSSYMITVIFSRSL